MLLNIKLYGGMVCSNQELSCYGRNKFQLNLHSGVTLQELHAKLAIGRANLVSIVDGKAQTPDYVLEMDCTVSIFLPMGDRQYDFLGQIK